MKTLRTLGLLAIVAAFMIPVGACQRGEEKPGPAEQAGKEIDKAIEQAGQEVGKVLEQAGEAVQETGKKLQEGSKK